MTANEVQLSIIGGGVYVSKLLHLLSGEPAMPPLLIKICARDHQRLRVIVRHAQRLLRHERCGWEVRSTSSIREAVVGSEAVIMLARIGGLPAREHDETFPRDFGLVGDEGLGAGGFANAWRTIPVLEEIATELLQANPRARVINLMAPLPITTRLFHDVGLDVVGVCELPTTVESRIDTNRRLEYLGVNHLGWFWPSAPNGTEILEAAVRDGLVHPATVDTYEAIPLPYYYRVVRPELGAEMGIRAPTGRAEELQDLCESIFSKMADRSQLHITDLDKRKTPWLRDALVPILTSIFMDEEHHGFATMIPSSLVPYGTGPTPLEYRTVFQGRTAKPQLPTEVPTPVLRFIRKRAELYDIVYEACRQHSAALLKSAVKELTSLPRNQISRIIYEICRPVGKPPRASTQDRAQ